MAAVTRRGWIARRWRAAAALAALATSALPLPTVGAVVDSGGSPAPVASRPAPQPEPAPRSTRRWVRATLEGLTLSEKAAQMVMVRAFGRFQSPRSEGHRRLLAEVRDLGVGGVVLFSSELESVPRLLNDLQAAARLPLLVAADLERGAAFRVDEGTVSLPFAMALGATRSEAAARFAGRLTAREGRALGIHWALAPVADVNSNPANPVINIRSFGEDPELVASLVGAFIEGARQGGLLTTAKHFPGHGDTSTDSHYERPVVGSSRQRLEAVELVPFERAVAAGVDAIMPAHVVVPALDASGAPATLSPAISHRLLRERLGFQGLIVTDALEMAGIRPAWTGEAAVRAVEAGADVLLLPTSPRVAVQSLVRAVQEGQLRKERLDESVRRILEIKARLRLHRRPTVDREAVMQQLGRPEDVEQALEIARASITLVRNEGEILPLRAEEPLRLLHLVISSGLGDPAVGRIPEEELAARRIPAETRYLGPEVAAETEDRIVEAAPQFSHVVVSAFIRVSPSSRAGDLSAGQRRLLTRLQRSGRPLIVLAFGSPYFLAEIPDVAAFACAYGWAESSQRAAVAALFGEFEVTGKLPVTLPELYPYGHGLRLARREMTLRRAPAAAAGFRPEALSEVDRLLDQYLARRAFPGGVVAVGHRGALAYLRPFGRLAYDADAAPVEADTIYDLASLTKVVATTSMAMMLVDDGELDLDKPVSDFLPRFRGAGKQEVTVRHLLAHSSGLPAGGDLYLEIQGQPDYVERIQAMELQYPPGSRSLYSDYGMILLGEILQRVAGQPLEAFVRHRLLEPLSMVDTSFRPGADLLPRIAPTEYDPWRGRMIRGEVHDENAFAMGGVAPHAGLFGTAGDLARFCQMILNGGVLEHRRIVSRENVERFTREAGVPDSDRALGWDTRSAEHSSAGSLFSPRSFGHLGFTGTSMWIDPERELFVILLTNRVHPTRDNDLIRQVRPAVADAVVAALAER